MTAPVGVPKKRKKRLAVFLDGTWNAVDTNTNVWRLRSLCSSYSADDAEQRTYYLKGVNGFWGGVFGKGVVANVTDAYCWLMDNYDEGDEIFIFGFSRGAFTARSLAGLILMHGLLKPGSPLRMSQMIERYKAGRSTIWAMADNEDKGVKQDLNWGDRMLLKYSMRTPIKFVGVWDTVGALGVPALSIEGISRSSFSWLHTGLRTNLENAFHAIAIDEHRRSFAPTLWTKFIPNDPTVKVADPRPLSSVEQRWFSGAHANVGGGYVDDVLAQAPLLWIMRKAASHGLSFRYDIDLDGDLYQAPIADSYAAFGGGAYSVISARHYRVVGEDPRIEKSGKHINVNETIDASVFERRRLNSVYRPLSLVEWAKRRKLDLDRITSSVLADDASLVQD